MNNLKEYLLYPVITSAVCSGIIAFADWKRGSLESIWWYLVAAFIMYAVLAVSRFLVCGEKK